MITATNLRKVYGEIIAVDDLSLSIADGEVFGLLGPNGAGKTTTINMLVGILTPDSGVVDIAGQGSPQRPEVRLRMGNAPQALALYDELTAEENLAFYGRMYGLSGAALAARLDWALAFAGLTERRSGRVGTFSGGMKRRLNMAAALVHDPPALLFDEPTVGVDPQSRNLIFDSIEQLKRDGRTIVYTTHYMEEAQRLCDRVAIVDHGRILAQGTVDDLTDQYGGNAIIKGVLAEAPADPANLPGTLDGNLFRLETNRPMEDLARLSGSGVNFRQLRVDRPDLEKVFLSLTGRRLRD